MICIYMTKKYCATYLIKKVKCANYEDLLPKYTTNNKFI